jgi:hypothetical protein
LPLDVQDVACISSEFWQQAVWLPSAEIDTEISTKTWAEINFVLHTDCLIFYTDTSEKCLDCVWKGQCLITGKNNFFQHTLYSLPDSSIVTASNHVPKSYLISRSAYDLIWHHLVSLIPWTLCYYKIFMNRGYLKCKI